MTDQENNLVGCVNRMDPSLPDLPSITWRFVTAMAKGEPHHWTSMGGDAQTGDLSVMFDGRASITLRPDAQAGSDPAGQRRRQQRRIAGHVLLRASMTDRGLPDPTPPTSWCRPMSWRPGTTCRADLAPARTAAPGLQTFSPGSSQEPPDVHETTGAPCRASS
jgi:hypothetical protein